MTLHEVTILACQRLAYEWELCGSAVNPTPAIRRIVDEMVPTRSQVRHDIEVHLHDEWARLCAQEGIEV
jgi:hypothetical protein